MAAAAVATPPAPFLGRKRCATPFLDEPPLPTKHARFSPSPAAKHRPSLDALRRIFPDADPRDLEAAFHASARNIHATVAAVRARQAKDEAAARFTRAATAGGDGGAMDECAGILVEQLAAAADVADAKNIASWILSLFKDAVAERAEAALRQENFALKAKAASSSAEAASMKDENNSLRAQAAASSVEMTKLREENAALKAQTAALAHDNSVLKRGVVLLNTRQEETASEMKKKVAELEMAKYALTVRLGDADNCRFQQAFRGAF